MSFFDLVSLAWVNLGRRRLRTVLTTLGVTIGVAALVLLVSLAIGLKVQILEQFQSDIQLRTILVYRLPKESKRPNNPFSGLWMRSAIHDEDLEEIRKLDGILTVYPELSLALEAHLEGQSDKAELVPFVGLPEEEVAMLRSHLVAGRFWESADAAEVVVPDAFLPRMEIKNPADGVGRKAVLRTRQYRRNGAREEAHITIVGVINSKVLGLRAERALLPISYAQTLRKQMDGGFWRTFYDEEKPAYSMAYAIAKSIQEVPHTQRRIDNAGFTATSATDILKQITTAFLLIEAFMACIGGIGLLVSLFGIANTMAMSVLERTREIGIMKAVGSRRRTLLQLFLMEAGTIGLMGGSAGLAIGWLVGLGLNAIGRGVWELPADARVFHVSLWLVFGSILFSVLVSTLAGLAPAIRAARMNPVEALRYE